MAPNPPQAGLDPVHILGICEHATAGSGQPAVLYTLARPTGITIRLTSAKTAKAAAAALARVGYQAELARPTRRCRNVLVTGWNAAALEARLAAMRATIQQLRGNETTTAAAAIGHYRRQPSGLPAAAATAAALTHTEQHFRAAIAARCGIQVPRDPTILPADTGNALRLRTTWALEQLLGTLTERHLREAQRALAQFRTLRRDGNDDWAAQAAIRSTTGAATPHGPGTANNPGATDDAPPLWPSQPTPPQPTRAPWIAGHDGVPARLPAISQHGRARQLSRRNHPNVTVPTDPHREEAAAMETENHPDPFQEATQHALQRAIQIASIAATSAQMYLYKKNLQARTAAERDERIRRSLNAQIRADRDAARAGWAPALDPEWLRQADVPQAAKAWGAAMPYADRAQPWYEPAAAASMRKCEQRLRDLHPHAMARYDRLRGDGMSPAGAMREAAPLFAGPPRVHAPSTPRPALDAGNGSRVWGPGEPGPAPEPGPAASREAQQRRGKQIIGQLQARARAAGRAPLGPAEQRTVLETFTTLPPAAIDQIVQPGTAAAGAPNAGAAGLTGTEFNGAVAAEDARAADLDAATDLQATSTADERTQNLTAARDAAATATAATARAARLRRPWERDFPMPVTAVVAAARQSPAVQFPAAARLAAPAAAEQTWRRSTTRGGSSQPRRTACSASARDGRRAAVRSPGGVASSPNRSSTARHASRTR